MSPNIREQRNKLHQRVMSQVGKAMRVKERKRKPELWVIYVRQKCRGGAEVQVGVCVCIPSALA